MQGWVRVREVSAPVGFLVLPRPSGEPPGIQTPEIHTPITQATLVLVRFGVLRTSARTTKHVRTTSVGRVPAFPDATEKRVTRESTIFSMRPIS